MKEPDRAITRYLLGQASAREQTRIEEEYFGGPDSLQRLLMVEDDLIDAYLQGGLRGRERTQFERYFMATPQRQEKVKMAQALLQSLHDLPVSEPKASASFWSPNLTRTAESLARLAAAAAFLLLVVVGAWLLIQNDRLKKRLNTAQDRLARQEEQSRLLQQQLEKQAGDTEHKSVEPEPQRSGQGNPGPESLTGPPPGPTVASFVLSPGVTRGIEDYKKLVLLSGTKTVKLVLELDTVRSYAAYRAELRSVGGGPIWSRTIPRSQPESVTAMLPSNLLHSGDYTITLNGTLPGQPAEFVGDYGFRIVKK